MPLAPPGAIPSCAKRDTTGAHARGAPSRKLLLVRGGEHTPSDDHMKQRPQAAPTQGEMPAPTALRPAAGDDTFEIDVHESGDFNASS